MAWAFVQGRGATGSGTSPSQSFLSNVTAGNLIIVCFHWDTTARSMSSVTDSLGNTYTAVRAETSLVGLGDSQMFYAKNIAGGACTVTGTLSGTSVWYCSVHEYSGVDTTAPLDVETAATGSGGSPSSGATGATAAANSLGFGFCFASGTASAGAGFTARVTTNGDMTEDKDTGGAGSTFTATFTQTGTGNFAAHAAVFKPAGGGGAPAPRHLGTLGAGT